MITLFAVNGSPVSSASWAATAALVSGYPALGMYRCSPGVPLSSSRRSSRSNSGGGSTSGLPSDRS